MIVPREDNLYEIHFGKVHKVDATNLMQYPIGDGALELWHHHLGHLDMKGDYTLQKIVSGKNLSKISGATCL